MGASPHLPHTEGGLPSSHPATPPPCHASLATGLLRGGAVHNSFNRGAPKFFPSPPILGSKLGTQGSWDEQVRLTQALPGSWPCLQPRAPPALYLLSPAPLTWRGVANRSLSVPLLPKKRSKTCKE